MGAGRIPSLTELCQASSLVSGLHRAGAVVLGWGHIGQQSLTLGISEQQVVAAQDMP